MSYTAELDQQLNRMLKDVVETVVKETGIHPLDADQLEMLRGKLSACAVEVWRDMGKPRAGKNFRYIDNKAQELIREGDL